MATLSRKTIIISGLTCVIVVAVAGYYLKQRVRESGMHWSEVPGAVYSTFLASECPVNQVALPLPEHLNSISMLESSALLGEDIVAKTFSTRPPVSVMNRERFFLQIKLIAMDIPLPTWITTVTWIWR